MKNKKKFAIIFLVISTLLLAGIICIDISGIKIETILNIFSSALKSDKTIDISGNLISPLDKKGIAGADVSFGGTSSRTDVSGFYSFSAIRPSEGIKINHPEIKKAILKKENLGIGENVYFDPAMFNELIAVADLESRGKFSEIYKNHLNPLVKNKISESDFLKNYQATFNSANLADQELVITKTELFEKESIDKYDILVPVLVRIGVENKDKKTTYELVYDSGKWTIIK